MLQWIEIMSKRFIIWKVLNFGGILNAINGYINQPDIYELIREYDIKSANNI